VHPLKVNYEEMAKDRPRQCAKRNC